jgi:hypothetical protein
MVPTLNACERERERMKTLFDSEPQNPTEPTPSLRAVCEARQGQLKEALARLAADGPSQTRADIEVALAALDGLLTGNLDRIPAVVAAQLGKWITTSKYLGAKEAREIALRRTAATKGGSSWPS